MATSDGPLSGIPDVRPCTLGGLDTPAAVELLSHLIGSTRVTCDPRAAESLVQELGGHPTALRLVASWLAALPQTLRRRRRHPPARGSPTRTRPRPRPPAPARPANWCGPSGWCTRTCRRRPPGCCGCCRSPRPGWWTPRWPPRSRAARWPPRRAPWTTSSPERCCTATGSAPAAPPPQYRVPGCLEPLLRALLETGERPEDVRLARARMLERTVRLLQSCRAALAEEAPGPGGRRGRRPACGSAPGAAAADWLRSRLPALLASARPPSPTANSTPWPGGWWPPWSRR